MTIPGLMVIYMFFLFVIVSHMKRDTVVIFTSQQIAINANDEMDIA